MPLSAIIIAFVLFFSNFSKSNIGLQNMLYEESDSLVVFADSSRFAILDKSVAPKATVNDKNFTLSETDLATLDKLLLDKTDSFNIEGKKRYEQAIKDRGANVRINRTYFMIEHSRYEFQLASYTNNKNEKIVWVNAFCDNHGNNWHTRPIVVKDGGLCYFNVSINLTTGKTIFFLVNGSA